jgi:hypothetical protein
MLFFTPHYLFRVLFFLRRQNELGVLEFIHALVETLDKYFENVCELDSAYTCSCLRHRPAKSLVRLQHVPSLLLSYIVVFLLFSYV